MRTAGLPLLSPPVPSASRARRAVPAPAGFSDQFGASGEGLAQQIETSGVACMSGVVTNQWLSAARTCIESQFPMGSVHELLVERFASGGNTFADRLVGDQRLQPLLESVVAAADTSRRVDGGMQADLRLVRGPGPAGKPPGFHYDGSVVTMVVPIMIPDAEPGQRGELILCPNRRPYRRSVITNVVEKFITQNDMCRRRFVRKAGTKHRVEVVDLKPGNAYLFWGYRSYHATLPCPEDSMRATLIIHFGNLDRDSAFLAGTMALGRKLREISRVLTSGAGNYQVLTGAS